jgi:hypothetical protein
LSCGVFICDSSRLQLLAVELVQALAAVHLVVVVDVEVGDRC